MRKEFRLPILASRSGLSLRDLEERTGIPRSTLQEYMSCKKTPPVDRLDALAAVLGVSPAYLAGWCDDRYLMPPISPIEAEILREVRKLRPDDQIEALRAVQNLHAPTNAPNLPDTGRNSSDNELPSDPSEKPADLNSRGYFSEPVDLSELIDSAAARKRKE